MIEEKKVPKIRFPGFVGEWEEKKVSDLIEIYNEKVASDCTLPVLTSSKSDGIQFQADHFGREQGHDIEGYNVLPRGFCTYRNRSDGTDFTFNINNLCDEGIISKFYPVFNTKDGNNLLFLVLLLNNEPNTIKTIAYTAKGTGQKVLSISDLLNINIVIPDNQEQKKVSLLFEQVNDHIACLQNELNKWKVLKIGLLQKMFPKEGESVPEIRFPGFEGPWEQRIMGDLLVISSVRNSEGLYTQDNVLAASLGTELEEKHVFFGLRSTEESIKNYRVVKSGDVIYTKSPIKGYPNGIVRTSKGKVGIVPSLYCVYHSNESINPSFIQSYLEDKVRLDTYLYPLVNIGARNNVNITDSGFLEGSIMMPQDIDEQTKIVRLLDCVTELIIHYQHEYDEWKVLKKGLLQQMFVA